MKSQVNQVFVYILTIVLVGIILLVGVKVIRGMFEDKCTAELATFTADLQRAVTKYNSYGALNKKDFYVPCDYARLCFVDPGRTDVDTPHDIINSHVGSGDTENVFLVGEDVIPIFSEQKIRVETGFVCFDAASQMFKITFRGLGTQTQIES